MPSITSNKFRQIQKKLSKLGFGTLADKEEQEKKAKDEHEATLVLKKVRKGKTKKDRESGAKERNLNNIAARQQWQRDCSARRLSEIPFPYSSCNGKKNPYRKTGKGGTSEILK